MITGNAARLGSVDRARGEIELAHSDSHELDLGEQCGTVRINYWVLARPQGSNPKKEVTGGYVRADSAICMTLYGQRQDQLPRSWIKENAKLPFLYKQIIVQIDADELTPIAKRELFASTRERATQSNLRRAIYNHLGIALRDDEELQRLNHLAKDRLMERSTAATNDKIRKRLARFIEARMQVESGASAEKGSSEEATQQPKRPSRPAGVVGRPRNTNDTNLPEVPTHIKFDREEVRLVQGARSAFWVEIDAKNDFLQANKDVLQIIWPQGDTGQIAVKSKSRLMGGRSRWYIACDPDTPLGEYKLRAEFFTANGLLEDTLVVRVVEPPQAQGRADSGGGKGEPAIDVRWVTKANWDEHNFTGRTVGTVDVDDTGTIIWVNRHYYLLERALFNSALTPEQLVVRAERYQYPVACALWLQDHALATMAIGERPTGAFLASEHERVAEAVLAAMNAEVEIATGSD